MTTDTVNLPPLPEPSAWIVGSSLQWLADPARTPRAYTYAEITRINYDGDRSPIFTTDDLRSYALLAVQEERRRCAEIADGTMDHSGDLWDSACICVAEAIRSQQP